MRQRHHVFYRRGEIKMQWGIKCIGQSRHEKGFERAIKTERGYECWFLFTNDLAYVGSINEAYKYMADANIERTHSHILYLIEEYI